MLPIVLDAKTIEALFKDVRANEGYQLTVDLGQQTIAQPGDTHISFDVDPFKKHCLINGLDQIGLTLLNEDKITAYERTRGIA